MREYNFYVYMLRCSDGSYYTGVINSVNRRLVEHQEGLNTKSYTFSRRPLELVYVGHFENIFEAITHEKRIKGWNRKKKEALIRGDIEALPELAKRRTSSKDRKRMSS